MSVSVHQYRALCESQTPFLCPACYREQHEGEVNELKSTVEALRVEVAQLKELIHDLREEAGDPASKPHKPSTETPWNVVVRREKRHPRTKSKSPPKDSHAEPQPSHSSHHTHPSQQSRSKNRMPVKGARKIWGTLRHTTSFAIQNTLKALTKSGSNGLTVKRKFKTAPSDRNRVMKWWFVLRGEEQLLEQLQDEWPAVSTQTSWKLEPVLSYTTILDDPGTATAEQPMESGERSAVNSSGSGAGYNDSAHENNGGEAMAISGPEVVEVQNTKASNHPSVSDPSFLGEQ